MPSRTFATLQDAQAKVNELEDRVLALERKLASTGPAQTFTGTIILPQTPTRDGSITVVSGLITRNVQQ